MFTSNLTLSIFWGQNIKLNLVLSDSQFNIRRLYLILFCFQVIHLQPHTLFINRVGVSICLQQCDCQTEEWINPSDPPKLFGWQSSTRLELLKVCEIPSYIVNFLNDD